MMQFYLKGLGRLSDIFTEKELMVPPTLQKEATTFLKELTVSLRAKKLREVEIARNIVKDIIQHISQRQWAFLNLLESSSEIDYRYVHALNVLVLTAYVGIKEGLKANMLEELGLAAFLHDIGMELIPQELLLKPKRLSKKEYDLIRQHPFYSYNLLRSKTAPLCQRIVYEHHERPLGTGYPRRLEGKRIHNLSLLVGVADAYDALTARRPYREPLPSSLAINLLVHHTINGFQKVHIERVAQWLSPYPMGSVVKLSSKETAIVIHINPKKPHRPVVRIFIDRYGNWLKFPKDIDLSCHLEKFILF